MASDARPDGNPRLKLRENRKERPRVRSRRGGGDDRGVVVVLMAASLAAILVMVALVLDYSGARRDRAADQVAVDAMALAAAQGLGGSALSAEVACWNALDYLTVNLPTAASTVGSYSDDCTTKFKAACSSATTPRTLAITADEYHITFTHPVPDGDALLQGRPAATIDGSRCQRFGIRVQQARDNLWASGKVDLDVSAVGRFLPGVGDVHAPLVLLADTECEVLSVGGSSQLTVTTADGTTPGYIAIDSNGADCGNKVVFDVSGSDPNGKVIADKVGMWAITAGNAAVAYPSGLVSPSPVGSSAPVGRTAMDWRYNCDPTKGCPGSGPPYIDQLKAAWGGSGTPTELSWLPGTFQAWSPTRACSGLSGNTVVPKGNWYINCGTAGLSSNNRITFKGGNVVSDGPIKAGGGLRINCPGLDANDTSDPTDCNGATGQTTFYLRSGNLLESGSSWGSLVLPQTFVFLADGTLDKSGNQSVTWTAPNSSTYPFDDLLLWTESTAQMKLTGTSGLVLEGTLFAPNAQAVLAGNMDTQALGAQIFANTAQVSGNAQLTLKPKVDRMNTVGKGRPLLIR